MHRGKLGPHTCGRHPARQTAEVQKHTALAGIALFCRASAHSRAGWIFISCSSGTAMPRWPIASERSPSPGRSSAGRRCVKARWGRKWILPAAS